MIEIKRLNHRFLDGTHALRDIDLTIRKGEFLLLCGPNGSGKTTLVRLIAGLLKPTSGSILINGLDATRGSLETRRLTGMVFQDADSQIIGETVEEDIAFGPENMGLSREEIRRRVTLSLQRMRLEGISDKPCYLLSGGEKRRLSIAGVLAMRPQAILFDEPFTHLDYPAIQEVLKDMIELHREGHTLLVTTHDVEKVISHVDRVVILHAGELKAAGPPEALLSELSCFGIRPPCYALLGKDRLSWLSE